MGYIPYCYLGAAIVVLYKLVVLVFTSFYQIKIEKRKEYLDEILAWQNQLSKEICWNRIYLLSLKM